MDTRGVAARVHDLPDLPRRVLIGVIILEAVGVAWSSFAVRNSDAPIAYWWPAIGVLFFAVLASRGRRLAVSGVVVVTVVAGNLLGGQPLDLAIVFGVANAVEMWIVVQFLTRGRAHADFATLMQIGRFLVGVGLGVVLFSVLAGVGAALVAGADPVLVGSSLMTSHASALFAIAPLVLVPLTTPLRVPFWEPIVQSIALVVLTIVVFGLAGGLGLTFLIITTLMWGAYRLPPLVAAVQTLLLAITATVATSAGIGPFAVLLDTDARGAVFALQLFIMTHAAATLFVSGQSADWTATTDALAARERDARHVATEALQLNKQKDNFIASVSHELRTPVTSILGFAEQLIEQDLDADGQQASRIIYRNARRLADVIEDVLELSHLTSSEGTARPYAEVDVRRLVMNSAEDATGLVTPGRDVRIDLRVPEHPVIVHAVEQDISRVCANLLSNAVKFSPVGGIVTVELLDAPDTVELRIVDQGPGVPLDELEAVWERFYRVQSPDHNDVPGTGLGLPIVRALVRQRLGGEVELRSDGVRGTTAVVRLPRGAAATTQPAATLGVSQAAGA